VGSPSGASLAPSGSGEKLTRPIHFKKWIDENRHLLKPPVGNRQIWADREFMVTVVGGPNSRTDYHINEGEEFFYQLEGQMNLRVLVDGKPQDFPIAEGEIFLLPPRVPHSPQRPEGTIGLVLERRRLPHELDSFLWVCKNCHAELWKHSLHVTDITTQLQPVFQMYYSNPENLKCKACGTVHEGRRAPSPSPEKVS
jgi:3-hydroxyanthranilate 3,4-dioxygenase